MLAFFLAVWGEERPTTRDAPRCERNNNQPRSKNTRTRRWSFRLENTQNHSPSGVDDSTIIKVNELTPLPRTPNVVVVVVVFVSLSCHLRGGIFWSRWYLDRSSRVFFWPLATNMAKMRCTVHVGRHDPPRRRCRHASPSLLGHGANNNHNQLFNRSVGILVHQSTQERTDEPRPLLLLFPPLLPSWQSTAVDWIVTVRYGGSPGSHTVTLDICLYSIQRLPFQCVIFFFQSCALVEVERIRLLFICLFMYWVLLTHTPACSLAG